MIVVVNYGLGNVQAIANIYRRLGIPVRIAASASDMIDATKVILPGVGAFDWAMTRLNQSGMRDTLDELVIGRGLPVLGICVGMQMLARRSEEGVLPGLHWIDADVKRFDEATFTARTHLPHMGWNDVMPSGNDPLFRDLETEARFYFLHSYYMATDRAGDVLALTEYNGRFASSVRSGQAYGVQFHPEKSHQWGIRLLQNFAEM